MPRARVAAYRDRDASTGAARAATSSWRDDHDNIRAVADSQKTIDAFLRRVREGALAKYPGSHLKSPWPDHLDLAVNDKTFAYLSREGQPFGVGCKLPHSNALALMLPNVEPAGYGLGKSGWISAKFPGDALPPIEMIEAWIDESYRAQAPKKLIAQLDGAAGARLSTTKPERGTKKTTAAAKPPPTTTKKTTTAAAKPAPATKKKAAAKKNEAAAKNR